MTKEDQENENRNNQCSHFDYFGHFGVKKCTNTEQIPIFFDNYL